MRVICLIFSLVIQNGEPVVIRSEKPMESLQECEAWKYQQLFQPSVWPSVADWYVCEVRYG